MACAWEGPVHQPCSWGAGHIPGISRESDDSVATLPHRNRQTRPGLTTLLVACIKAEHVKQATDCLVLTVYHAGY